MLHVRESKTVSDSGFHKVNSRFHLLDSGFFVSGTPIVSGIPNSLNSDLFGIPKAKVSCIPESVCPYPGRSIVAFILHFFLSLHYRNGTHRIPFPPKIWTSEMTQDLRAAYDADLELKLRCKAAGNRGIQVGAEFNTAGLRRNKLFYFGDVPKVPRLFLSKGTILPSRNISNFLLKVSPTQY